ncbi:MAG TPA: hypothetical protein VE800_01980 [Actinomycetota bacterium]|nr:hypothetical protein [Actinomycetota bacterium]
MTSELKERFALADEVGSSELWSEARRRAAGPERRLVGPDRAERGDGGNDRHDFDAASNRKPSSAEDLFPEPSNM